MPKQYRGGKGRAEKPLTEAERMYDEIDRTKDGIAVIKAKPDIENSHFPLYSNSPDTVYFALDKNSGERHSIGIYKDYQLVEVINYDSVRGNHYHKWDVNPTLVRGKKTLKRDSGDYFNLTDKHKDLINKFNEWWNNRG